MANSLSLLGVGPSGASGAASIWDGTKAVEMDTSTTSADASTAIFAAYGTDYTTPTSFSMWLGVGASILSGGGIIGTVTADEAVLLELISTRLRAEIPIAASASRSTIAPSALSVSTDYHIAVVAHPTNSLSPDIWVGGVKVAGGGTSSRGSVPDYVNALFSIGRNGSAHINAKYADICVALNTSWSDPQVAISYNGGSRVDPTTVADGLSLSHAWGMGSDGDDETIIQDLIGSVDLTPVNIIAADFVTW